MLLHPGRDRGEQAVRRARFGEETEDSAVVDRANGSVEVGLAGEQHPAGVGGQQVRPGQDGGAVDPRHAHVAHQYRRGPTGDGVGRELLEREERVDENHDVSVTPQGATQRLQHVDLVVDDHHAGGGCGTHAATR